MSLQQQISIKILKDFKDGGEKLIEQYGQQKLIKASQQHQTQKDQLKIQFVRLHHRVSTLLDQDDIDTINCLETIEEIHALINQYNRYPRSQRGGCSQCYPAFFHKKSFLQNFQRHVTPTLTQVYFRICFLCSIPKQHAKEVLFYICNKDMHHKNYRHQVMGRPYLAKDFQTIETKISRHHLIDNLAIDLNIKKIDDATEQRQIEENNRLFEELEQINFDLPLLR